jgi:hypothetical protein
LANKTTNIVSIDYQHNDWAEKNEISVLQANKTTNIVSIDYQHNDWAEKNEICA